VGLQSSAAAGRQMPRFDDFAGHNPLHITVATHDPGSGRATAVVSKKVLIIILHFFDLITLFMQ